MVIFKTKEGIVPANENNIVFTDVNINDDSILEVYYTSPDVYTISISQEGDDVYITCNEHLEAVGIKLFINNVTTFEPYNDNNLQTRMTQVEQKTEVVEQKTEVVEQKTEVLENELESLNASNIKYDDGSTLYSAMGDIDSLETTSKNLVGAINEVKESGGSGGFSGINFNRQLTAFSGRNQFWTATEDCWAYCVLRGAGSGQTANIRINGTNAMAVQSTVDVSGLIPLKKGQIISTRDTIGTYNVWIYGLL